MIAKAIQSLRPKAQWVLRDNELEWLDTIQTQPTEQELALEIARLEAEYIANQYQRDRAKAYPSIENQLDDLYHNGLAGWNASIKAIKEQYPKG